jgi:hypothetical protein
MVSDKEKLYDEMRRHYENDIEQYKNCGDNWDGYGSAAISEKAIDEAIILIAELKLAFEDHGLEFVYPDMVPDDGFIGFDLTTDTFSMDIDVNNTSNYVNVIARTQSSKHYGKWRKFQIEESFFDWLKENGVLLG